MYKMDNYEKTLVVSLVLAICLFAWTIRPPHLQDKKEHLKVEAEHPIECTGSQCIGP